MDLNFNRKTNIIATMGPSCRDEHTLTEMFKMGINIIRLNFSHGSHDIHEENISLIKKAAQKLNINPGILVDLQGPKIRTGEIENNGIEIKRGDTITFTPDKVLGTKNKVTISYPKLAEDIKAGERILLDDGLMEVTVKEIKNSDVICTVETGGILKPNKGVNLPNIALSISPITEKDKEDLYFAIKKEVDYIALSFVRTANEVIELKKIIHEYGVRLPVIAKIEKSEAVDNIDSIIDAADGIMVARGDLGVETSPEEVPLAQKMIINKCSIAGKPVIVATQMLESMITNPRPTRAEATDVANAIFDGADAIMLSGETAAGQYPLEAVSIMDRIACKTEKVAYRKGHFIDGKKFELMSIPDALSHSIANLADNLSVKYIIAFTHSGNTAKYLSKYRSSVPIIAMTHEPAVMRHLSLYWGINSIQVEKAKNTDEIMEIARKTMVENNLVKPLDIVVISTGVPLGTAGTTNMLRVMQFPKERQSLLTGTVVKDNKNYEWAIDEDQCLYCGICTNICSCGIYENTLKSIKLNKSKLKDCYFDMQCVYSCPAHAISIKPKKI